MKPPTTPSSAQTESKRAYGSNPKQLSYDNDNLGITDAPVHNEAMEPEDSPSKSEGTRAAVKAFIEGNKRWNRLTDQGISHVFERIVLSLSLELANVERANWNKHLHERLGKVAGFECGKAKVRVEME